jgi:uncharacterized protein (TIGR03086 family)
MPSTTPADTLAVTTPSATEIVITRTFAAPRHLVFAALTEPDLLVRWHGAQGWTLETCEVDLRVGGAWRFVSRGPGGAEMTMFGVYTEIERPDRLVHTESFEGSDAGEAVVTTVLAEDGGRTTFTATVRYPSQAARDAVVETRMAEGVGESYRRLDEVLAGVAVADRFTRVAGGFSERVAAVPPDAWDNPAPCEGWVARDVVRHLVEWMPALFFDGPGLDRPHLPSVDDDPVGAWEGLRSALQAALDDPAVAGVEFDTPPGRVTVAQAIDQFGTNDILVHTWDLARATGLDETLDATEVSRMLAGVEPYDEAMRQSGHYGPRVEVPDGADEQTRLIAFTGRRP